MSESFMLNTMVGFVRNYKCYTNKPYALLENKCVFAVLRLGLNDSCRRGLRFGDPC
jgi:hypothetical protein